MVRGPKVDRDRNLVGPLGLEIRDSHDMGFQL